MSTSTASQQASTSRHTWTSKKIDSPESVKRIRNGLPPSHQTDPLIESLDEHEEVEIWLNNVINSRRGQRELSPSALQLRVDNGHDAESINTPWTKLTNLESQLSSLSSTLSFARQDTISIIDSTISNVTTTIPKLGLELRLMKDAALTLKSSIDNLRLQASQGTAAGINSKNDTSSSTSSSTSTASAALERLSALFTLHSKMVSARDVLSLAESWSTLSADVSSYLSDGKYSQACSRLAEAKTSLVVFERTPEYEGRKKLFEGLCNSLVTSISPSLEDAAKEKNAMDAQRIGGILSAIGRGDDFAQRWRKARTSLWLAQWKTAKISRDINDEGGDATLFSQSLQHLLDNFLVLLNEERLFVPILFPKHPRKSMGLFASSALLALDPSLENKLSQVLQTNNRQAIIVLVQIHFIIKNAVAGISKILSNIEEVTEDEITPSPLIVPNGNVLQVSPAISPMSENKPLHNAAATSPVSPIANRPRQGAQSRRMSNRRLSATIPTPRKISSSASDVFLDSSVKQSATDILLTLLAEPTEWEMGLLEPLLDHQMKYAIMERRFLNEEREKESLASEAALKMILQGTPSSSTLLGPQIWKTLREDFKIGRRLTEDSLTRCLSLTFGLASDDLIFCVDEVFVAGLNKFKTRLGQRSGEVIESARKQARERLDGNIDDGHHASSSTEDDQWKSFEEGIELLSILHQCEQVIDDTEREVAERLKDTAEMVLNGALSSGHDALLRLCGQGSTLGISKAPLAILVRQITGKLQAGSLVNTLESALTIIKDTRPSNYIDRRQTLFKDTRTSLIEQLKGVQRHLIDMTLAPLLSHMEIYTQLPIWEAARLPGSVNEYELAMPTFSLSPTEEMSRIGEGLLDLPRLLEVWNDNVDLRWAARGLPHFSNTTDQVAITEQAETQSLSPSSANNKRMSFQTSSTSPTTERRANHHRHSISLAAIATVPADNGNLASMTVEEDSDSVLQTYLSSIALSLLSQLTSLVLPSISKLTLAGSLQLVADLEYLLNILSALNVDSSSIAAVTSVNNTNDQAVYLIRILEAWKDSCKFNDVDGKRISNFIKSGQLARGLSLSGIKGFQDDEERLNSLASTQAFEMVARMRGW